MKLTLMFREYCSLCHKMRDELKPLQEEFGFELEVVDVDEDAELEAQYNELVPVLLHKGRELCHWHLNEGQVREYLISLQVAAGKRSG
ncbi:glutaredoxin family protein [Neisseria wadsworthii]|uniref:Glutaredoxin 2 n=1 Tax=Neisseria wadsworthii 9715 TaxID=1030841 RepID=G4CQX8_9NEIS|nr:glutaredoxin family protein [Neisseria wadsworthii]EGZ45983.1 glutaredoxin 2 [Neisseria wadsworthii 9715]QMT35208.1 glutaredoxin family protein [Neisseria wadsworthii]